MHSQRHWWLLGAPAWKGLADAKPICGLSEPRKRVFTAEPRLMDDCERAPLRGGCFNQNPKLISKSNTDALSIHQVTAGCLDGRGPAASEPRPSVCSGKSNKNTLCTRQVAAGCARMEEAMLLLNDGGAPLLAPALQQEIQESLHDLKPQCVLDHLKVPATLLCSAVHVPSAVFWHECFVLTSHECFITTTPHWA